MPNKGRFIGSQTWINSLGRAVFFRGGGTYDSQISLRAETESWIKERIL